ncbi:alpha/beta hydrolase [Stutzerimonas stutzeri]|uniref:alpha/beta hydrolase n=1 Tax=Stutzerimonas stutzeri TaxID=316 RepID=UPI0002F83DA7|nr:alpha/beta hydrolase-fold protein [Stutzerimonas stutzeri]
MNALMALLIASLGLGCASARAAEAGGWKPVVLPQAEQRDIHSHNTGDDYRIFISQPQQPAPPGGYPVLYVLDGNALFPMLAVQANARERRPDPATRASVVVVGIGYPGGQLYDIDRRARDYTPPTTVATDEREGLRYGGADRFLAFVQTELKPLIEARYPIHPYRQTLFGHSHGGLLTLYALMTQPDAFQNYLAASPSIWWNDRQLLEQSGPPLSESNLRSKRLWMTVGEYEEPLHGKVAASERERRLVERRMRSNVQELFERWASLEHRSLKRTFTIHQGAGHGENSALTAAYAIDFALLAGTPSLGAISEPRTAAQPTFDHPETPRNAIRPPPARAIR